MSVKRWITAWPTHLRPLPGSSTSNWENLEVVPAAAYDALAQRCERLEKVIRNLRDEANTYGVRSEETADAVYSCIAALAASGKPDEGGGA